MDFCQFHPIAVISICSTNGPDKYCSFNSPLSSFTETPQRLSRENCSRDTPTPKDTLIVSQPTGLFTAWIARTKCHIL